MTAIEKDPPSYVAAVAVLHISALYLLILAPLIVGGLITGLQATEVEVGLLVTLELLVAGAASMLMSPVTVRVPAHMIAMAAGVLVIIGNYMSSGAVDLNGIYPWRVVSGLGMGMLLAINNAVGARGKRPAVLYGIGWFSVYIFTAGFAILMTTLHDQLHHSTVYLWLTMTMIVLFPFYFLLPKTTGKTESLAVPKESLLPGLMLMVSVSLIVSAMMAYYAFLERIAMNISGNTAHAGIVVALSQIGGIVGAGLAVPLSIRYGIMKPLVVVTALHAVFIVVACATDSIYILGIVAFAEAVGFIMYTPLIYALVAEVDRQGRWAAIAGGVFVLSSAIGPLVGGYFAETSGYILVSVFNIAAAVPAIILCIQVGRRVIRQ